MFCENCGVKSAPGERFCGSCGASLFSDQSHSEGDEPQEWQPHVQSTRIPTSHKTIRGASIVPVFFPGLAVLLTFFIPGLGQLYLGRIGRGIVLVIAYGIFWIISILTIVFGIVLLIFWIWAIYDANNATRYYCNYVQRTGQAPW